MKTDSTRLEELVRHLQGMREQIKKSEVEISNSEIEQWIARLIEQAAQA